MTNLCSSGHSGHPTCQEGQAPCLGEGCTGDVSQSSAQGRGDFTVLSRWWHALSLRSENHLWSPSQNTVAPV